MEKNKFKGCRVTVKDNEPLAVALRRFKRKVDESKVLETIREKEFYEKSTTKRKRKKGAAQARWKKRLQEQQLPPKLY